MKTGSDSRVLYQIRAAPPRTSVFRQTSAGQDCKPRTIIFNGISANSWLLPIGISQKDILQRQQRRTVVKDAKINAKESEGEGEVDKDDQTDTTAEDNEAGVDSSRVQMSDVQEVEENVVKDGDSCEAKDSCNTDKARPLTATEFDSLWERVPKRPKSTGSVYIVKQRQLPEGIGKHECIQGRRLHARLDLSDEKESLPEGQDTHQGNDFHRSQGDHEGHPRSEYDHTVYPGLPRRRKPRPYTAPSRRYGRHKVDRICLTPKWRPMSQGSARVGVDHCNNGRSQDVDSSLDLVVTSLDLHKDDHPPCDDSDKTFPRSHTMSANPRYTGEYQRESTDTVEGIKRSYLRRAKSAPPNVRTSSALSSHDQHDQTTGSRGPSLYWRAKSTYHKKLMAFGPDGEGLEHRDETPNLRGSFWRPLMVPEDGGHVMQHSSGCPYKCKGCFKACLVSEDYLQKARAEKLLREKEERRTGESVHRPTSVKIKHRSKARDARNIVNTALARSQPLYKMVHGERTTIQEEDVNDKQGDDDHGLDISDRPKVDTADTRNVKENDTTGTTTGDSLNCHSEVIGTNAANLNCKKLDSSKDGMHSNEHTETFNNVNSEVAIATRDVMHSKSIQEEKSENRDAVGKTKHAKAKAKDNGSEETRGVKTPRTVVKKQAWVADTPDKETTV